MFCLKIMLRLDNCISKINSASIDNAEDFNIVIPMYNILEYSQNYSMTSERLWNYYEDKNYNINHNTN